METEHSLREVVAQARQETTRNCLRTDFAYPPYFAQAGLDDSRLPKGADESAWPEVVGFGLIKCLRQSQTDTVRVNLHTTNKAYDAPGDSASGEMGQGARILAQLPILDSIRP